MAIGEFERGVRATVGRVMISEIPLTGFSFRTVRLATSMASSCGQMPWKT